jgi:hypothetical protein
LKTTPGKRSCVSHFLDQTNGLIENPHGNGGGMKAGMNEPPEDLRELLYRGTSGEFEGEKFEIMLTLSKS